MLTLADFFKLLNKLPMHILVHVAWQYCGGRNGTLQRKIKSVFVNRICFCVSKQKWTWIQQLQLFSYSLSSLAMVFCSTQACLQIPSSYNNLECIRQGRRGRGGKSNFGSTEDHAHDTKYMSRHLKPNWNLLYNDSRHHDYHTELLSL